MKLDNIASNQEEPALYSLESVSRYEKIPISDIVKPLDEKNVFLASDMDGTMFKEDLGIMVFLEKLKDPHVWERFTVKGFSNLLLPIKYKSEIEKRTYQDGIKDLNPEDCSKVLLLKEDLVDLYSELKKQILNKEEYLDVNTPLVNEFARKMIEFDGEMIKMDSIFAAYMKGLFLMRTRFFTGLTNDSIDQYVKNIFNDDNEKGELVLKSHIKNRCSINQELFLEPILINNDVHTVNEVRDMICTIMRNKDVEGRIVTTNLQYIADKAIQYSNDYEELNKNERIKSLGQILQKKKGGILDSKYFKLPVFANRKLELINKVAAKKEKKVLVSLGDSPTNDGPMIFQSLKNGGIGVMVGKDIETIRSRFFNLIEDSISANGKDVSNRIFFAKYS